MCVTGYASIELWKWLVFWTPVLSPDFLRIDDTAANPFQASLTTNAVVLGLLFVLCRRVNPLARFGWLAPLAAGLTSLGCAVYALNSAASEPLFLMGAASMATGAGSAVLLVLWGERFSHMHIRQTLLCLITAAFLCGAAGAVLIVLPVQVGRVAAVAAPLISLGCLVRFGAFSQRETRYTEATLRSRVILPVKMVVVTVFFGVLFGVMRGVYSGESIEGFSSNAHLNALANMVSIVLAAVIVFSTVIVAKLDFRRLTVQITSLLVGLGFMLLALPYLQFLAMPMHVLGIEYFYIILFATMAYHGEQREEPASWLFACGLFFLQAGQMTGALFGTTYARVWPGVESLHVLVDVVLFVLLAITVGFFESVGFRKGYNLVRPGLIDDRVSPTKEQRAFDQRCTAIGQSFGLSARESEVFLLLARSYNRPKICETLMISDETVKTHIKHIYQKMSIHTRDELQDLIAREVARDACEGYGL